VEAVYFDGEKAVYRKDYPKPTTQEGESLIRILVSAVCSTDREILKGYFAGFKGVMGHEFVGIVEESRQKQLLGKRVVGEINLNCGECVYCQSQRERHCENRSTLGIYEKDGCFAQYITLPNHLLHLVPHELENEVAVFTEPLAAAVEIPSKVHIDPEQNIAIIGDGRLSFLITQVLSLSGAELTVVGKHSHKLNKFKPYANISKEPRGKYEYVVEATGNREGLLIAKELVRSAGTIITKSTYNGKIELDMSRFVVDEITLVGSRCGDFSAALNLLQRKLIDLPQIKLYNLKDYKDAFETDAFKAGFVFE